MQIPRMIQLYCICAVWGEPLSQTTQSFMPELIYGANRSLAKVRELLKSLVIIGGLSGLILGSIGTSLPWLFPKLFSSDSEVIREISSFFLSLVFSVLKSYGGNACLEFGVVNIFVFRLVNDNCHMVCCLYLSSV